MKKKIGYYSGWFILIVFALVVSNILTDTFYLWEKQHQYLFRFYQSVGLLDGEYRLTK